MYRNALSIVVEIQTILLNIEMSWTLIYGDNFVEHNMSWVSIVIVTELTASNVEKPRDIRHMGRSVQNSMSTKVAKL